MATAIFGSGNFAGADIGKLQPVQVVRVMVEDQNVYIQTDTGNWGSGPTLSAAIKNMKETASAEIFLDTAEYLLITDSAIPLVSELSSYLRPSCVLCREAGQADLALAGQYLQAHPLKTTLIRWQAEQGKLPILIAEEERMTLVS